MKKFDIDKIRIPLDLEIQEWMFLCKWEEISERKFDFDIFLPSYQRNLQRELVWSLEQKQEFIISCIKWLYIPPYSFIVVTSRDENWRNDIYEVIDWKQRLTTIISYYNNEFPIIIEWEEFYYKDLDDKWRYYLGWGSSIKWNLVHHYWEWKYNISDEQKLNWFKMLNYSWTPLDKEHISSFNLTKWAV